MGKKKQQQSKSADSPEDDHAFDKFHNCPLAKAVMSQDTDTIAALLSAGLPSNVTIQPTTLTLEQSRGESFTGGRSTPVYHVRCQVQVSRKTTPVERKFVIKLVVLPGDDSKILHKRASYAVERRFYDGPAIALRTNTPALTLPTLLHSDTLPTATHPPVICLGMTDVSVKFPAHPAALSPPQAASALRYLAVWHACFWQLHNKSKQSANANFRVDSVWSRGGFWTPKVEENDNAKYNGLSTQWLKSVLSAEKQSVAFDKTVGTRLQAIAEALSDFLSRQTAIYGTLIHGDYKAANLFFKDDSDTDNNDDSNKCASVDFQYCGCGLPAEDVAYLLYPDALGNFTAVEESLLHLYHEHLLQQLMAQGKGGPTSYPWHVFRNHYFVVQLDLTRHWLSRGWVASAVDGDLPLLQQLGETLHAIDGGSVLSSSDEYKQALERFMENGNDA